jgi:hypothetical protein
MILNLSIPPRLRNALKLQAGDLKLHVLVHLGTCLEIGGETADPKIDSLSIHLARKFGQLKATIELHGCWSSSLLQTK